MSNTSNTAATSTIITGRRTRLSYAQLFEPKGFDGSKPVYSASLIIPKDDKRTLDLIRSAIKAAYEAGTYKLRGKLKWLRLLPLLPPFPLPSASRTWLSHR